MINPAGWYPQPDGQQRYWDGQKWTGHRAQGIAVVSLPAKDRRAWFRQRKVITAAGSVVLLGISLGVVGGGLRTEATPAAPVATVAPVASSVARRGSVPTGTQPSEERAFVEAVAKGRIDYLATTNELNRHLIKRTRDGALCEAVPFLVAKKWYGTITRLTTKGSKNEAILEVEIGTDIKVSNEGPGATLIPTASPMYRTLARRNVGERIQFSGTLNSDDDCPILEERWVSRDVRMTNPNFSIDFTDVYG